MKKATMEYGESTVSSYWYNTTWPEWAQRFFRAAVMYYLKERDLALSLMFLGDLFDKFIEENESQKGRRVVEVRNVFGRLKLIRNRVAHPGEEGSENVVSCRDRLVPLCLQLVDFTMNDLYPARKPDELGRSLVLKVQIGDGMSSSADARGVDAEKETFYRSVQRRNDDIMSNLLDAIPCKHAIMSLSLEELEKLLEDRVMEPAIIHEEHERSFAIPFPNVSKGICLYRSSREGWMCCASNGGEDIWKDDKWSRRSFFTE